MPVDARAAFLPFVLLPVLYVCQFIFPRRAQVAQVIFLIVACIVLLINYGAFLHMGAVPIAILVSLSWGLFALTAHYRCMHTDLVVQ